MFQLTSREKAEVVAIYDHLREASAADRFLREGEGTKIWTAVKRTSRRNDHVTASRDRLTLQRGTILYHCRDRDALLPKLLSGEIRVKDAEKFAETGCAK